ncbi:MAG TPA: Sjogren's syndrome/scleroderma autoantigen 1 family protein [Nitrosopumilaceae archaeon]|nr:Sjogren's syndrome/scleroderma autoantigen 1 family protein [Nitrosopumilaceae archaeon]
MSNDLTKRAADMLLKGATLLAVPCPYCKGVRVMKDGNAFCVSCGREPNPEVEIVAEKSEDKSTGTLQSDSALITLAKKLESLSKELEKETDYEKQQQILKSINSLVEIIAKLRS